MFKGIVGTCIGLGLAATMLSGCGGGGGSSGNTVDSYNVSLRTDVSSLPLNVAAEPPRIGGPYTSTIYVSAKDLNGNPVPSGQFSCNIINGLDSGALYYLDGDPEHEETETIDGVEVTTPIAYRSVTLDSNAGTASFHYHAYDIVGSATIRCAIVDAGGTNQSKDITLQVGGQSTGKVSQVIFYPSSSNYIFVQGMNAATQAIIQTEMVDEAGQLVAPASGANNLQVRIIPVGASLADDDAILRGVNAAGQSVSGSSLHVRGINGQAQFTLVSGSQPGAILLEAISDRADNNVSNGITEPIYNYASMDVVTEVPQTPEETGPLTITTTSLSGAATDISYGALVEATGGKVPYTWTKIAGGLPNGLSFSSSGIISGTPYGEESGTFTFVAKVTDALGNTDQEQFSITYTAAEPEPTKPTVTTTSLANGRVGTLYLAALTATGGDDKNYTWSATGLPPGLTIGAGTGVISGTPTAAGTYSVAVIATSGGIASAARVLTMVVDPAAGTLAIMTTALPNGTVGAAYSSQIVAAGGTLPYAWSANQLPAGLTVNAASGVISGTPTVAGTFTIRITVTDGAGTTIFRDLPLTIAGS
jgi:hypothetical protein